MIEISPDLISGKKVLLRYDIDVPIENGRVVEEFRLKAGLPTLRLCLENASEIIILGHIGRPGGREVPELSVEPIYDWLVNHEDLRSHLSTPSTSLSVDPEFTEGSSGKLKLLENLRFEKGEEDCDENYAKELASYGDFYVNEAFAAHHKAASTTVLPTLLPHAAGLRFAEEVKKLTEIRENPKRPLVVIIGGVKIEDKLPAIEAMAKIADYVIVGGKIVHALQSDRDPSPASPVQDDHATGGSNVHVGQLTSDGMDISEETVERWKTIIKDAKMVVWNGPLGKVDSGQWTVDSLGTTRGTYDIAKAVIESGAESIIGGGDTISVLSKMGFLSKFSFVSTGGGAMLKFLSKGTLPTIQALE